jgi:acyl-CoA reductase-like NAD-dependent aldehyde dehydrogenase
MAKKASPKKRRAKKTAQPPVRRRENLVQRIAERVETRLLEAGEMATETTSAETNLALAALTAVEGLPDDTSDPAAKDHHGKRKSPAVRPKKR